METRRFINPGFGFNSAKFFDIEYQTYGWVRNELQETEQEFYWESANGKICLHMVFQKDSKKLLGINAFGVRFRHEVCERWIDHGLTMDEVMVHLKDANFDPEFFKQYEIEIVEQYNIENNSSVKVKKRSWKRIFQLNS